MDYIKELRKLVGRHPLIMVGSTVLLFNQHDELLLIKRTDNKHWGIPGGSMELGESLEGCARRETLEETGIEVTDLSFFGMYSGEKELHYTYPNGDEVYMVTAVYRTRSNSDKVTLSHEHDEYLFVNILNLPINISPTLEPIIRDLILNKGKIHV